MKPLLCAWLVLGLTALAACERDARSGPPTLRPGRDECAECGMAIHDERSAAAILIDRDGRRDYLLFDDIGCMLDSERSEGSSIVVLDRFVRDYATNAWLRAESATFLATDGSRLRTPMASGLGAFNDRAAAEAGQQTFGGKLFNFSSLSAWRQAQMEARRAAPGK